MDESDEKPEVGQMVMPGFWIGGSVIESRVYLSGMKVNDRQSMLLHWDLRLLKSRCKKEVMAMKTLLFISKTVFDHQCFRYLSEV
ncbi:hypothetical protein J1N35_020786 [Gossypium stocksii]|uniref:Uncharacterized protein n=1 Tax=Gossypium stocksii TaxID=47602 RepID=A0A9D4A1C7_9ROSI|nr:hypothetical protein J1N35_020786 [Gossypium stocksii]